MKNEQLRAAVADKSLRIIANAVIGEGDNASVRLNSRKLLEFVIKSGGDMLFIAHNHPTAEVTPSQEDISSTKFLKSSLENFGIILLDHVIVGGGKTFSMKEGGFFSLFK